MAAFWIAFFFVFMAEMGDKTQLMTLTFATRYRARTVLAAVLIATLVIHLFSVSLGEIIGLALPLFWINLLAGIIFVCFGLWTLRQEETVNERSPSRDRFGPLITVAATFFLAEIGDRTMLATVMIATRERSFFSVWFGSTAGMALANGLAIMVGRLLGKRLPEKLLHYGTALIFVISGLFALVKAIRP